MCGLFLTDKKTTLLLFHIVVHAIPLPISFLYFLLACLTVPASLILILRGTLTTSLPLLFSFSLPGHQQCKVIYLLAKQQNKMPWSEKCICLQYKNTDKCRSGAFALNAQMIKINPLKGFVESKLKKNPKRLGIQV